MSSYNTFASRLSDHLACKSTQPTTSKVKPLMKRVFRAVRRGRKHYLPRMTDARIIICKYATCKTFLASSSQFWRPCKQLDTFVGLRRRKRCMQTTTLHRLLLNPASLSLAWHACQESGGKHSSSLLLYLDPPLFLEAGKVGYFFFQSQARQVKNKLQSSIGLDTCG